MSLVRKRRNPVVRKQTNSAMMDLTQVYGDFHPKASATIPPFLSSIFDPRFPVSNIYLPRIKIFVTGGICVAIERNVSGILQKFSVCLASRFDIFWNKTGTFPDSSSLQFSVGLPAMYAWDRGPKLGIELQRSLFKKHKLVVKLTLTENSPLCRISAVQGPSD